MSSWSEVELTVGNEIYWSSFYTSLYKLVDMNDVLGSYQPLCACQYDKNNKPVFAKISCKNGFEIGKFITCKSQSEKVVMNYNDLKNLCIFKPDILPKDIILTIPICYRQNVSKFISNV
jgi:hypothetical protein